MNYQLIPASLFVSLNVTYTIQRIFLIYSDIMYDNDINEKIQVKSMKLSDKFGQVTYYSLILDIFLVIKQEQLQKILCIVKDCFVIIMNILMKRLCIF